jgi:hypothetical protein
MRTLIVSHGTQNEVERAYDLVNCMGGRGIPLCAPKIDCLVNLDVVRAELAIADALVLVQCSASSRSNSNEREESELQRVERLAVLEAAESGKFVCVIGDWTTLHARHFNRCGNGIRLIGLYQTKLDKTGGAVDRFPAAQFVTIDNMQRGAQSFINALDQLAKKAAA